MTAKEIVYKTVMTMTSSSEEMDRPRDVFVGALQSISEIWTLDYDSKGLTGLESEVRKAVNTLKEMWRWLYGSNSHCYFGAEDDSS